MADLFKASHPFEPRDYHGRWTEIAGKTLKRAKKVAARSAPGLIGAAVSAASFGSAPSDVTEAAGEHIASAARYAADKVSTLPWRRIATRMVRKRKSTEGTDDMAGLSVKRLNQIEKLLEGVFDGDEEQLVEIGKSFDGLRASVTAGTEVTMDDLSDILGDVVVEKAVVTANTPAVTEGDMEDPIGPVLFDLYKALFEDDGTIKKGINATSAQTLFNKAYNDSLEILDSSIEAAAEATAIEFGKAKKKKPAEGSADEEAGETPEEEDAENMEKLLKSMGVTPAVITRIAKLQKTVEVLEAKDALQGFEKQAIEIGEGAAFGAELLKLHQADPALAKMVATRIGAKNQLLKKSQTWSAEIGGGSANGETPNGLDRLNAYARDAVEKGAKDPNGKPMTFAKAFSQACTDHPDVYAEYREEERRRGR